MDWILALIIAETVLRPLQWGAMAPLAALLVMHAALVGVSGRTLGHRITGLRVARVELIGRGGGKDVPTGLGRGLVRAALLCLAVPPLITDRDNRGLHDRAAGTVVDPDQLTWSRLF